MLLEIFTRGFGDRPCKSRPDGIEWLPGMDAVRGYGWLCGGVGVLLLAVGLALYASFFRFHAPGGPGSGPMPMGPNGYYFVGFAGTGLVAWGIALLGAARRPALGRAVGTATAVGCVLGAVQRMLAWLVGDYASLGELPRIEAGVLLLLALGFVWLRPPVPPRGAP